MRGGGKIRRCFPAPGADSTPMRRRVVPRRPVPMPRTLPWRARVDRDAIVNDACSAAVNRPEQLRAVVPALGRDRPAGRRRIANTGPSDLRGLKPASLYKRSPGQTRPYQTEPSCTRSGWMPGRWAWCWRGRGDDAGRRLGRSHPGALARIGRLATVPVVALAVTVLHWCCDRQPDGWPM